ncbi:MAG: hypothetical protein JO129_04310 [Candidatus Dependentiae bacterium]|nr:hypothetical protein [Candidatus Dependentiae bacterium]
MKLLHQQLFVILLCSFSQISGTILYNNSDNPIKYNIFNKQWLQLYSFFKPFPIARGTLLPHSFHQINNLDEQTKYIVTFYDVHNAHHNERFIIQGNKKKLVFTTKNKKNKSWSSFVNMR